MNFKLSDIDIKIARKLGEEKTKRLYSIPYRISDKTINVYSSKIEQSTIDELSFVYDKNVILEQTKNEIIEMLINKVFLGCNDEWVDIVIKEAIKVNASDIHFEPREDYMILRMRIDGKLTVTNLFTIEEHIKGISKLKVRSELDITEKRRPQDGKLTFFFNNNNYDLRMSFTNTIHGEKLVIRILYGQVFNYQIENLNLTKEQIIKLKNIIKVNNGLIIVNGPTGSGKSTTLYTILQEINKEDVNIMTLEDPVEVVIPGVNQIALNKNINMDFAEGLKSILRQDPDIVMVGEIRDDETAKIAVRASITGHKVYSTIHTKSPRDVFIRLEDMGVKDYFIKESLVGIISQRLIRVLCTNCKKVEGNYKVGNEKFIGYKGDGCVYCNFTGYNGRALVAAVHCIDRVTKENLSVLSKNYDVLSNYEMIENLKVLLVNGSISVSDYEVFVDVEEINYKDDDKVV